jgi:lipopolysaccharide export system permease protein
LAAQQNPSAPDEAGMIDAAMPSLLSRYIARRLLSSILFAYAVIFTLLFLVDFVDLLQESGSGSRASILDLILIGLQRTPLMAEEIFPFTVLFAAIAAFVSLSRKLELVVARATGVSIWQMLAPALLTAGLLGMGVTAIYNPASTWLKERAGDRRAELFMNWKDNAGTKWIRQQGFDDSSILRASESADHGRTLTGVTAFVFDKAGALKERIDASRAQFREGFWEMRGARVTRHGSPPESLDIFRLNSNLTEEQVAETIAAPETISFWDLPRVIAQWQASGIRTDKFQLQYQTLIARPLLYVSMVLIAAAVSLGFTRLGGVPRAILGGVIAGFVLYVGSEMAGDLGAAGFITPVVAAWSPSIVGVLLSVTVLLYQEDG